MAHKKLAYREDILNIWKPIENLPNPMYVEAIYDDYDGFRILLKGESVISKMLRVTFQDSLSYRNTDESYLLKIWNSTEKAKLGKIFYLVENSSYVDFFNEMTENIYSDWDIKHYAIYTTSDCIDVISANPPIIEWLD